MCFAIEFGKKKREQMVKIDSVHLTHGTSFAMYHFKVSPIAIRMHLVAIISLFAILVLKSAFAIATNWAQEKMVINVSPR